MFVSFDILTGLLRNGSYIHEIFFNEKIFPKVDSIVVEDEKIEYFLKGYAYEKGIKTEINQNAAIKCYEKSFSLGFIQAKYRIGLIQISLRKLKDAMISFKEIKEDSYALYQIALLLLKSDSNKKVNKGFQLMEKLSDQNFIDAMIYLGEHYLLKSHKRQKNWMDDYKNSILLRKAAIAGSGKANYILGKYEEKDLGVIYDSNELKECTKEVYIEYLRAIQKGYLFPIEEYYSFFKKYNCSSINLDIKVAEQEMNPKSLYNVGIKNLKEGHTKEANEMFLKAYELDHNLIIDIQNGYTQMYNDIIEENYQIIETDKENINDNVSQEISDNENKCKINVSVEEFNKILVYWSKEKALISDYVDDYVYLLQNGIGTAKDSKKAYQVLENRALKNNDNDFHIEYLEFPINENFKNAPNVIFESSKKLAFQGFKLGFCALAFCYKYGLGTKPNEEKCTFWKRKANMSSDFLKIAMENDNNYNNFKQMLFLCAHK